MKDLTMFGIGIVFLSLLLIASGAYWFMSHDMSFNFNNAINYASLYKDRFVESIQNHPVTGYAELEVSNINGPITIKGHKEKSIQVTVTKVGDKNHFKSIHANIYFEKNKGTITTSFDTHSTHQNASIEYEILVPFNTTLEEIKSINGAITIENVTGKIEVQTANGKITLHGIAHEVEAETLNGMIEASFTALPGKAHATLKTNNGALKCTIGKKVAALLEAQTRNGAIDSDFAATTINKTVTSQEIKAVIGNHPTAEIKLKTNNGAITIIKGD